MTIRVLNGDMLAVLPTLDASSIHACITDPPYHLTSIVKRFGSASAAPAKVGQTGAFARASRGFMGQTWDGGDIAMRPETWAEVFRVMKPGAFMVAFASTRGYHRMACAIEDAGFVIHPMLAWAFGSGMPKAHKFNQEELAGWRYGLQTLKPSMEPICLAQKPLDGTGSANWATHGCGGLNIDACRIEGDLEQRTRFDNARDDGTSYVVQRETAGIKASDIGRFPANLIHDGSDEVMAAFAEYGEKRDGGAKDSRGQVRRVFANDTPRIATRTDNHPGFGSATGSASRFFYSAKASKADRGGSKHPTVKPLALMSWLVKLITPPGGTILDPFAGSGTTLLAADRLQFSAIGIEQSAEYVADIHRRLRSDAGLFAEVTHA